ncbi:MAG: hypothetical protein HY653_06895 [Acidobacteria bacterium]|nr:hypothetical protein [Acidobacteriota bacterium]
MRRNLALTLGTLLFVSLTFAAPETPKKPTSLRCTLTNTKIETCCCQPRGEKLYCPLAKKTIVTCCCQPVEAEKKNKSQ